MHLSLLHSCCHDFRLAKHSYLKAWPWVFCFDSISVRGTSTEAAQEPLIVSAEAAHVAARRHIGLVHIPDFLSSPPEDGVQELGLKPKNIRQIAGQLRDAEKCLVLTQKKGGGRFPPVYLHHSTSHELLDGENTLSVTRGRSIRRDRRSRPVIPHQDPAASAVATSLASAGISAVTPSKIREYVKNLPADTQRGRFPEESALYANPQRVESERKVIHPLSQEKRPSEAAKALLSAERLLENCDDKLAVAFAATSLPVRYATVLRIFEELKFRDKTWNPSRILEYSAGPGCGMWAAMQVWRKSVSHMTAVEHRPAMVRMGVRVQDTLAKEAAQQKPGESSGSFNIPSIRWLRSLPSPSRNDRDGTGKRRTFNESERYSVVVCTHSLARIPTNEQRMRMVRELWSRVAEDGVLLLVEAGTPVGSAFIRQAREQILREDYKSTEQLEEARHEFRSSLPVQLSGLLTADLLPELELFGDSGPPAQRTLQGHAALRGTGPGVVECSPNESGVQTVLNSIIQEDPETFQNVQKAAAKLNRLQKDALGAYVVAPCAHDGVCPMDTPGQSSWCHFSQRVERKFLHRQCRYRKGIKNGPKNWEYERYSYVLLRRSPRPPPPQDVYIIPAFREYEEDALQYMAVPPELAEAAKVNSDPFVDPLQVFPFFKSGKAARGPPASSEKSEKELLKEAQRDARQDIREDIKSSNSNKGFKAQDVKKSDSDDDTLESLEKEFVDTTARKEATEFLDEYLKELLSDPSMPAKGALQSLRVKMEEVGVLPRSSPSVETVAASLDFPAQNAPETVTVRADEVSQTAPSVEKLGGRARRRTRPGPQPTGQGSAEKRLSSSENGPLSYNDNFHNVATYGQSSGGERVHPIVHGEHGGEKLMLRGRNWLEEDPEGVELTRKSCSAWSRIIRKPLKRGKHVVLDLCVASKDQRSGQIEQHIVAHSDRKRAWLGPAAYRLARHARWGDLWPSIYHKNHRVRTWM